MAPATETFRWTDERGGVHYSDRVPPEQARNRRARLNAQGFEVEVVEAPKTVEQIRNEELLTRLRAEQEKVLNEQRDRDRALMRTYRNADEILAALKVKLDSLDGIIKMNRANLDRDQQSLAALQRRAGETHGQGLGLPQSTQDSIAVIERRLSQYRQQIQRTEEEKRGTTDRFKQDLKRFQSLSPLQERQRILGGHWTQSMTKRSAADADFVISAVKCLNPPQCERQWETARHFLARGIGYPIAVDTRKILQTPYPGNDSDFGVTITLIPWQDHAIIFMDIICRPTSLGEQLCKSGRIRELNAGFVDALMAAAPPPHADSGQRTGAEARPP